MSELDLEGILDLAHDCDVWNDEEDVPRLTAEIRKLVTEVERLRAVLTSQKERPANPEEARE